MDSTQMASTSTATAVQPEAESSAQAIRRSSDYRSVVQTKKQKMGFRARFQDVWHHWTGRPSLLSSTSDSADTGRNDDFEQYHSSTDRDPRLYRINRKRSRGRHRHRGSQAQSGTIDDVEAGAEGDDLDGDAEKPGEEERITSKVVVENDFSTWIDPQTGRVTSTHHEVEDDGGSMHTGKTGTEHTETIHHGPGKVQKAADEMRMPWLGRFLENVRYFFDMSFPEKDKERAYLKDVYFVHRQIALSASIFFIVMWVLVCATTPRPYHLYDYYAYIGIYGVLTLPLLPVLYLNVHYRMPIAYQVFLTLATWSLPDITVINVKTCGVWEPGNTCDTRSFFIAFASAIGQPVLALLALGQSRLFAVVGAAQCFIMIAIMFFNQSYVPSSFYRDIIYYIVFHIIILIIDAFLERRDRQMFELREQLKTQFRATQRAQLAEKRAADLKKRFASYIFHEVRVPLNTALLAVQNLEGDGVFKNIPADQKDMVHGLSGSLSLMEKVLNDVLSFNRMESGKFSQAKAPFDFHRSIELTALSHSATAQAKGIALTTDLDSRIDQLGCAVIGDEMRLRQVTSNLVSNSLKFTITGSVSLRTKLLLPVDPSSQDEAGVGSHHDPQLANGHHPSDTPFHIDVEKHAADYANGDDARHAPLKLRPRMAIIRIEIADTGVGLRHQDMVENRLFSPYVQTEIGRRQGGKGTGLGLALVRQIVELNRGRLGVDSEYGKGSVFWLEMPFQLKRRSMSESRHFDSVPSSHTFVEGRRECSTDPIMPAAENTMVEDPQCFYGDMPCSPPSDLQVGSHQSRHARLGSEQSDQGPPCAPLNPVAVPHGQGPLNALIVDDDKLTRMMMVRMLQRLGHKVTTAEHGKEGLEKLEAAYLLQAESPGVDVVFLDNQMPFMSGVEVSRAVRATGNPVYIVGCTGNALREDQEEYIEAGADRVLTKPIKQAAVLEAIELARKRLRGESFPRKFESDARAPSEMP